MATEPWVDRERAIWNVLPLHPRPEVLESFTSYMIRLAEANGLQSLNELTTLAGMTPGRQSGFRSSPDSPAPPYAGLAQLTGCPEERLLSTTFFPLAQRFGCSPHPNSLSRFLAGSIAAHLRYCPMCLTEHSPAYHRLFWRFRVLSGCSEHGVHLLEQCGHCGSALPLWTRRPHLTTCSVCQGDLTTCQSPRLSEEVLQQTQERTADLIMLLTPLHKPLLEKQQAKLIGKRFMELRQRRDLLVPEVAHLLGREAAIVLDIDQVSRFRQATLDDYWRYAALLGCSLREIFDETSLQALLLPPSEEHLLAQAEAAIRQLQARSKAVRPGSIGDLMGMTVRSLEQYPRLKTLLNRCETERRMLLLDAGREEDLIKQVEHTLNQLAARGEPIVLHHVCDLVGLSYSWMVKKYPRIRALFYQYQKNRPDRRYSPRLDEEAKVQQVQAGINMLVSHGEPVTLKRIRQMVRLTQKRLRSSPRVRALLAPYTEKWRGEAS
jgi:hypothetical protein